MQDVNVPVLVDPSALGRDGDGRSVFWEYHHDGRERCDLGRRDRDERLSVGYSRNGLHAAQLLVPVVSFATEDKIPFATGTAAATFTQPSAARASAFVMGFK
jgi:hypothetical protein